MILEVALQYNDSYAENLFSFANNINTREGGTHLVGFKAALTRTINQYASSNDLLKKGNGISFGGRRPRRAHGGHQRQIAESPI